MAIVAFDTLEYSKTLQDAGMERNHADAFARAQAKAMADMQSSFEKQNEASRKELATKGDIQDVRDELKKDIQDVREELKKDIQDVREELKKDIQDVREELKKDIQDVREELKKDIQDVREELKEDVQDVRDDIRDVRIEMKAMEIRLMTRLGAMIAASVAIVAALVKWL